MLLARNSASSIRVFILALLLYLAVPVNVEVCVPAVSVTDTVAFLTPVGSAVSGLNCTVIMQVAPGARVVWPSSWPPPAGPQVEKNLTTLYSFALAPASAPCVMPVSVTLPVLVNVNVWAGSKKQAKPGQLRVWLGLQFAGVRLALTTGATPVPVRVTGEPVTATLAVIVAEPVAGVVDVGVNVTVMVQVPATGVRVAVQVPPALANGAVTTTVMPVKLAVPVLCRVRVCGALVVPTATPVNVKGPPVTLAMATEVPPPTNSTAPESTAPFVFLEVPKKSTAGASVKAPLGPPALDGMRLITDEPAVGA